MCVAATQAAQDVRVAACCSVSQCVAVCSSWVQCVAVCVAVPGVSQNYIL